jgi:hypothetical protein
MRKPEPRYIERLLRHALPPSAWRSILHKYQEKRDCYQLQIFLEQIIAVTLIDKFTNITKLGEIIMYRDPRVEVTFGEETLKRRTKINPTILDIESIPPTGLALLQLLATQTVTAIMIDMVVSIDKAQIQGAIYPEDIK